MDARPRLELSPEAVPAIRASMKFETIEDPLERGVERREIKLERPNDDGTLRCLMYTPLERATPMPAYLHIHGGGYLIGAPEMSDPMNVLVASKLGCIVLSVDYRLAPEHPAPCGIDDCFLSLAWLRGYKWSKVDITTKPRVLEWVHRVRARPAVARGLAYGVPEDEIDSWSKDRRANYAKGGASIADNASIAGRGTRRN